MTIIAVTQVLLVIVTRPLRFVLESDYARLVTLVIWELSSLTSMVILQISWMLLASLSEHASTMLI